MTHEHNDPQHVVCLCRDCAWARDAEPEPIGDDRVSEMRYWKIAIAAYKEPSRLARMASVGRRLLLALGDAAPVEVCDHKGLLMVKWRSTPTPAQRTAAETAWKAEGESADAVEHYP